MSDPQNVDSQPQRRESQIEDRRAKLEKIRALGADPYGQRFPNAANAADIRVAGERLAIEPGQIIEAPEAAFRSKGRIHLLRDTGKLIFMTVRDWTGDIQWALSKKDVTAGWDVAKLLDLGDIVGADGRLGRTKTGELTLWVTSLQILSKCLRPPPDKHHGLTDVEQRYRRRYVDLLANEDSQRRFLLRARIIDFLRSVLRERGFVEVETPVLQPIYGGAAAQPFTTHHNTLDMRLYLRISPELYLKRCLVGGLERVYEFARCFRNEGISPRHNPEFTMLELYQAYGDYHDMMDITEALVAGAAKHVIGSYKIELAGRTIDFTPPWPRRKYADLFEQYAGFSMADHARVRSEAARLGLFKKHTPQPEMNGPQPPSAAPRDSANSQHPATTAALESTDISVLINALFEHYVEKHLIDPTFVIDYPAPLCPLTRRDPADTNVALRFEAYVNAMEMGNAYSELNDPAVQRENLSVEVQGEGEETMRVMDEDFIEALEYAMPPAGGLGIGIDRLCMLLTDAASIREVLLFPLQRPQAD